MVLKSLVIRKMPYYMNRLVRVDLELKKNFLKRKFDFVCILCGPVGAGKTTLAQQFANYVYQMPPDILETFAFNLGQFRKLLDNKSEASIVFDESIYLMSSNHMKSENKEIKMKLTQCRSRRLAVFLCIPDFFVLDRSIVERASALAWVRLYKPETERLRGFYRYYKENRVLQLYDRYRKTGKKYFVNYPDSIDAYFPGHWVIDEDKYEVLKRKHTASEEKKGVECLHCGSGDVRYSKQGLKCRKCGFINESYNPNLGLGAGSRRSNHKN